jgi:processive 1,2-diacylglycerol beta-glucosyltransferase
MPQEELTVKFFQRGAGVPRVANPAEFSRLIESWMSYPPSYELLRDKFLQLRYEENPTVVIQELVDLAQEASKTNLKPGPFPPKIRRQRGNSS